MLQRLTPILLILPMIVILLLPVSAFLQGPMTHPKIAINNSPCSGNHISGQSMGQQAASCSAQQPVGFPLIRFQYNDPDLQFALLMQVVIMIGIFLISRIYRPPRFFEI